MEKITIKKINRKDFEIILSYLFEKLDFFSNFYYQLKKEKIMVFELLTRVYHRHSKKITLSDTRTDKRYNFIVTRGESAAILLEFPIGISSSLDQILLPIHQKLA